MRQAEAAAERALRRNDPAELREAFSAFRAAADLRPDDPTPVAEAGLLASDAGLRGDAALLLDRLAQFAPTSAQFHFLRGTILHRLADYEGAALEFREAVKGGFRTAEARDRLFKAQLGWGRDLVAAFRLDDAVRVIGETVALSPENPLVPGALYDLAVAHRLLQQPKEAEKVLRDCLRRFPTSPFAYGELGSLLAQQDRHAEALRLLEEAVKVDPGYPQGWMLKAMVLLQKDRLDEADAAFREHEKRFPTTGEFEYWRGTYFVKRAQWEAAIEHLRLSLNLDPKQIRAHYQMMLCLKGLGRDDEAKEALQRFEKAEARQKASEEERRQHMRQKTRREGPPPPGERPGDKPGETDPAPAGGEPPAEKPPPPRETPPALDGDPPPPPEESKKGS